MNIEGKRIGVVVAILLAIVIFFGFIHIITGPDITGFRIVAKESFGYSETFINMAKVVGVPWIVCKTKYPISVSILQKYEYVETDEEHEARVQAELAEQTRKIQENLQKEIDNIQEDYEKEYLRKQREMAHKQYYGY